MRSGGVSPPTSFGGTSGRFEPYNHGDVAMPDADILALAEVVWDYHQLHHEISTADAILVLCSHDTIVAERGAELFLEGRAPLLIFSGGSGASPGVSGKSPKPTSSPGWPSI